ncbi:putative bifunctional diguanylate cyclase/phosphodiesterase [Roseateles sp. BYS96W]
MPASELFVPMLLAAIGLATLWRLGAWLLPLVMAGLLAGCALPLWCHPELQASALLGSGAVLGTLALPLLAALLNRRLLYRLGVNGRLAAGKDIAGFALLAGLAAPLLAGLLSLPLLLTGGVLRPEAQSGALVLAGGWGLALLSTGTLLQASTLRPRRDERRTGHLIAAAAIAAQAASPWLPGSPAALLVPHLLLCLHALQASPRHNATLGLGLLALWALGTPASPLSWAAGTLLALMPLAIITLNQRQMGDRDAWRGALDAQGLALAEWQLPGGRHHASARWLTLTAPIDPDARAGSAPLDWVRSVHPRDREPVRRALRELIATPDDERVVMSLRLAADGGDWQWHELRAHAAQRDRQGRARSLILTLADMTWQRTAEERARLSATLFQQTVEGLAVVDLQWRIVDVNPAFCELLHASRESLVGRPAAPLTAANLQRSGRDPAELQALMNKGQPWSGQLKVALEDGGEHIFATRLSPVPEAAGTHPRRCLLGLTDLGESLRQQEQVRRSLRYDVATGLPNRDEFVRLMQQAMAAANRDNFKLVVAIIDLDDFGRLNAEHGQLVADAVLLQLSARLQTTLRSARGNWPDTADHLARFHGDEFGVLLRVQTPEEAQRAVDRLLRQLSMPVALRESRVGQGLVLEIGASMGATVYPLDDADPETLLRHAGHALYRAKHAGRHHVQFHDTARDQRDEAGLIATARLQQALDANELLLHYQPQIDLRTGQVMGVEALLRWQHPERGLLTPAHFLPQLEATGLAVQVGDWVIEQALAQSAIWQHAGLNGGRGLPVSVNVGARQLNRADFPQRLQELMQRQDAAVARLLHLDVLESDALAETAATQALIQRCMHLGVGIALDDFGAGYSHLATLKRLSFDTLKLHRSYVQGMLGDAQDLSLVESVIGLGRNIGCAVLAKGIESRAHARELLRLGCRLGQGNGIAAAMPPASLPGWIQGFTADHWIGQLKAPTKAGL